MSFVTLTLQEKKGLRCKHVDRRAPTGPTDKDSKDKRGRRLGSFIWEVPSLSPKKMYVLLIENTFETK